jgi:NAD(P)-dependent dehydrogenase (short-subunit alcohol dehydrogenase family)
LSADAAYVIIGGTGGIGRSMARRFISRGARHIVLLSRKDTVSVEVAQLIKESQQLGASIYVKRCDAAEKDDVDNLLAELAQTLPPIRGVIHAAMVLKVTLLQPTLN